MRPNCLSSVGSHGVSTTGGGTLSCVRVSALPVPVPVPVPVAAGEAAFCSMLPMAWMSGWVRAGVGRCGDGLVALLLDPIVL